MDPRQRKIRHAFYGEGRGKKRSDHGLLESRTGNFNITQKNEKTDALISERSDEIV